MRAYPCPICGRLVDPDASPAMPFCSQRCRQIDLARWLGEHYRVSGPTQGPEEPEPADSSAAEANASAPAKDEQPSSED